MGYSIRSYPCALAEAVAAASYKPGWLFALHGGSTASAFTLDPERLSAMSGYGAASPVLFPPQTLVVQALVPDSGNPEKAIKVAHSFLVPPPHYAGAWDHWILSCVIAVETHEAMEHFAVNGVREFYPAHGGEGSPYEVIRRSDRRKLCSPRARQPLIQRPDL